MPVITNVVGLVIDVNTPLIKIFPSGCRAIVLTLLEEEGLEKEKEGASEETNEVSTEPSAFSRAMA